MTQKTNLIFDMNNIAWIIRHATKLNPKQIEEYAVEFIAMSMIDMICNMYKEYQATGILCAYDSPNVWRKTIYADYKNRDHDDIYYAAVKDAIDLTKEFFDTYTNVSTSKVDYSEADDIIAVSVQENTEDTMDIIISSDKDFIQLLQWDDVKLYSPSQSVFRESEDPGFDLFDKCVRGDRSDNIFSAYPRVRKTVLIEAYKSPEAYTDFMETVRKDGVKVGQAFDINKRLIDLSQQPQHIRERIKADLSSVKQKNFNHNSIIKFARDHKFTANLDKFIQGDYNDALRSEYSYK